MIRLLPRSHLMDWPDEVTHISIPWTRKRRLGLVIWQHRMFLGVFEVYTADMTDTERYGTSPATTALADLRAWNALPPAERAKAASEWMRERIYSSPRNA